MPRRWHSSTSQAAPWRPGATITASALNRLPSVQATPVADAVAHDDALDRRAGAHRDARLEVGAHGLEDVGRPVAAHVAHRRGHERHAVHERLAADGFDLAGSCAPWTSAGAP